MNRHSIKSRYCIAVGILKNKKMDRVISRFFITNGLYEKNSEILQRKEEKEKEKLDHKSMSIFMKKNDYNHDVDNNNDEPDFHRNFRTFSNGERKEENNNNDYQTVAPYYNKEGQKGQKENDYDKSRYNPTICESKKYSSYHNDEYKDPSNSRMEKKQMNHIEKVERMVRDEKEEEEENMSDSINERDGNRNNFKDHDRDLPWDLHSIRFLFEVRSTYVKCNSTVLEVFSFSLIVSSNISLFSSLLSCLIYQEYFPSFWYWEVVESARRMIFIGLFPLFFQGQFFQVSH